MTAEAKTRTVKLGELLSNEQGRQVLKILKMSKNDTECVRRLREYLHGFNEQLESKGVLPDYLAYYLLWKRQNGDIK